METPAEYHVTPPLLRPLNSMEITVGEQLIIEHRQLRDALTQAKIALGDRHAEIRMMRVAVDVLTTRALKAENELGSLYAHIFEDGGHKQTELTGQTVAVTDWLTGQPTGERIPALPAAAVDVLRAQFARAEKAEAERDEATRELEYERQMREQTEKAIMTLSGRVKEQQAELAEAEREKLVAYEAMRKGRNTTTGTGLPGFTVPQVKGVAYWEPAAQEGKEAAK